MLAIKIVTLLLPLLLQHLVGDALIESGITLLIIFGLPVLYYFMTWIISFIFMFKKNMEKYIIDAHMLMPLYYMFITVPLYGCFLYLIQKL